jgi:hypothetical protein
MEQIRASRPSPAIIVAVLALVAALAGTAIAGPQAISGALTKSTVKKIAKKQINKLAPALSVANAVNAQNATNATNADALEGQPASAFAASTSEPYHEIGAPGEPAFQNGWANFDATNFTTAGFYKDPLGVVHLKGTLVNAADNSIAFQLPPGYRPSKQQLMPMASEAPNPGGVPVAAKLEVESDGEVRPDCDGAGCASAGIDGVTFRVP